jgi:hypothetical protein
VTLNVRRTEPIEKAAEIAQTGGTTLAVDGGISATR